MNKKLMGIIAVVVAVIAGALMMTGGGAKPEESFELIKSAAAKKDVASVEKYVDFDAMAKSVARCDFVMGAEADNPELAPLTAEVVASTAKAFRAIAASGNIKEGAGDMFSDALADLQKNTGFRSWSYVGVSGSKMDGDKAVVAVKVKDGALDKEYTLDIDMAKENDVWRVKSVSNLNALAAQRSQDVKAKLAKLNKEVLTQIAKAVSLDGSKMTHFVDRRAIFADPNSVKIAFVLKNNDSKRTITKIRGKAEFYKDGGDNAVLSYDVDLPYKVSVKPGQSYTITMNRSMCRGEDGTEVKQIVNNFGNYKQKFTINSVKFDDGSVIEPLRSLPAK